MVAQLGFSTMLDAMEFARKTWSQLNLPAAFAPTMDVNELDRRIQDLKAVEQWLGMNLNMLRSTIQTMEVQRGTIAALQAFGNMVSDAAGTASGASAAGVGSARTASVAVAGADGDASATSASGARPTPAPSDRKSPSDAPAPEPPSAPAASSGPVPPGGMLAEGTMMDPTAWWNMLQQQFQQVAGSALAGAALAGKPGDTDDAKRAAGSRPPAGRRRGGG